MARWSAPSAAIDVKVNCNGVEGTFIGGGPFNLDQEPAEYFYVRSGTEKMTIKKFVLKATNSETWQNWRNDIHVTATGQTLGGHLAQKFEEVERDFGLESGRKLRVLTASDRASLPDENKSKWSTQLTLKARHVKGSAHFFTGRYTQSVSTKRAHLELGALIFQVRLDDTAAGQQQSGGSAAAAATTPAPDAADNDNDTTPIINSKSTAGTAAIRGKKPAAGTALGNGGGSKAPAKRKADNEPQSGGNSGLKKKKPLPDTAQGTGEPTVAKTPVATTVLGGSSGGGSGATKPASNGGAGAASDRDGGRQGVTQDIAKVVNGVQLHTGDAATPTPTTKISLEALVGDCVKCVATLLQPQFKTKLDEVVGAVYQQTAQELKLTLTAEKDAAQKQMNETVKRERDARVKAEAELKAVKTAKDDLEKRLKLSEQASAKLSLDIKRVEQNVQAHRAEVSTAEAKVAKAEKRAVDWQRKAEMLENKMTAAKNILT